MPRSKIQSPKLPFAIVICVLGAISAHSAAATTCPPGYHGSAPHCQPDQAHPDRPYTTHGAAPSSFAPTSSRHIQTEMHEPVDRARHKPQPGAPVEHRSNAAQTHAIIFVGGKNAINSQPVPPGHSPDIESINSQPVPPGRAAHRLPQPGAPIERGREPEVKQHQGSPS